MTDIIQTKLANRLKIKESAIRQIVKVACEYKSDFVYRLGMNVLVPRDSELAISEILAIKETSGVSYPNATRHYFEKDDSENNCVQCAQYKKINEQLRELIRLSNKAF